jgi:hypothetical protein
LTLLSQLVVLQPMKSVDVDVCSDFMRLLLSSSK